MTDCVACGEPLTGRQRKFCGSACSKRASRAAWIEKVYGITLAEWDAIFAAQGGGCGICQRPPRPGETFHLDHEHSKGQSGPVRGILCPYCNTRLIGRLKDHTKAQLMADYLREPPATRALGRVVIAPGRPKKKRSLKRRRP
ncbi:endonuclease VII domain-containing protein [Micromonospora sp. NBC_01813]|uniref:endonuclease VII domain-containing protein n=1 Tax=Micromonospora sp. NBC_01813 TaxID=2975988 RepID=UPI002DD9F8A2|nr:endonuclease VII domain-containing protein [Micromonospora sp. NBC_01813]WSA11575.1 endonuclease VII domain-containing protein [Micromonospora sp. NBC_01813]